MIKVIIADDHEIIRDGFRRLLDREEELTLAGEAGNSHELFELLENTPCDVLVLDYSFPGKNGLEILKDLQISRPRLPVLMLSMHPEERHALRAIKNGASGYITKGNASEKIVEAVRRVAEGGRYISDELADGLAEALIHESGTMPHETLSDREYEIMLLIGGGKSAHDIADILSISANTVHTYRRRIMEKMEMKSNAQIIQYALRHQLIE